MIDKNNLWYVYIYIYEVIEYIYYIMFWENIFWYGKMFMVLLVLINRLINIFWRIKTCLILVIGFGDKSWYRSGEKYIIIINEWILGIVKVYIGDKIGWCDRECRLVRGYFVWIG